MMQGQGYPIVAGRRRFPSGWLNTGWTYNPATGLWSPGPVGIAELITNGGFANWTGDNPNNWIVGSEDANNYVTQNPAGKCNIVSNNTAAVYLKQEVVAPIGSWITQTFDLTITTLGIRIANWHCLPSDYFNLATAGAITRTFRVSGANPSPTFLRHNGGAANSTIDNVSVMVIPLAHILNIRNYGQQAGIAAFLTFAAGLQAGVVTRLSINPDGTRNFLLAWHDGTNAKLDTVVNDVTVVSKVSAAAAYGAARIIEVRWASPDVAQLWYHGSQIGADQDVSALPAGTWAGLFGTNSGVSIGMPVIT